MSQDLTYIKNQLKVCDEVESPYDIKIGNKVKYITIKNGEEYFFDGGTYVKMGDNKIVLKVNSNYEYVPLIQQNKEGFTVYRTRLFVVDPEKVMNGGGKQCSDKDATEYEKIIKTQQDIIEKLNIQLKKQSQVIHMLHEKLNQ
jgi:hypothetical protein